MAADKTPPRKVLVTEDTEEISSFVRRTLEREGYVVEEAHDGPECLEKLRQFRPSLLILDMVMPGMHGIEVLQRIRDDPYTKEIGVIVCSSRAYKPDQEQAAKLGALAFLVKPFERDDLLFAVDSFFDQWAFGENGRFDDDPGTSTIITGSPASTTRAKAAESDSCYIPMLDTSRGMWRLWGTRGSTPTVGQRYARYGGNTSCFEVRAGDSLVIIDAGSGIRDLGTQLAKAKPRHLSLFVGHTHWDHIQGYPFFAPAYIPGFRIDVYGAKGFGKDLESVFSGQLDYDYFPVAMEEMASTVEFHVLKEEPTQVGPIKVAWEYAHHPGATAAFRIDVNGFSIGYMTDNEFLQGYTDHPGKITKDNTLFLANKRMVDFMKDVDVLIAEAQYFNEEYANKIGWGHSSLSNACLFAKFCKAKRWIITHHDPAHDDETLERKLQLTRQVLRELECTVRVEHAYDGMQEYL